MLILGISAFYHDSAAALLRDGDLVAAAQEERFTRVKYDHRFPEHAIAFCLRAAGTTAAELDYVVFYEKPLLKFERILLSNLATYPKPWRVFREAMTAWFKEKLWVKALIAQRLGVETSKILFVEHHLSHAASAMFCSPFEEAAVLTLDGVGEWTTTAIGTATADWERGERNSIVLDHEIRFPHSLGLLYSAFTAWLGFKVNSGEYKVMGMAPYGEPRYLDKVEKLIEVYEDGSYRLNTRYFSFHHSLTDTFNSRFIQLFGEPRTPGAEFITAETGGDIAGREEEAACNRYYADVAASVQHVTEEVVLRIARTLRASTGKRNLALAGGVALNSVANGRVMREAGFDAVYIQPNAGDAGGALGAALYAYHVLLRRPRRFVMEHAYYGAEYSDADVRRVLEHDGVSFEYVEDPELLAKLLVQAMARRSVVGLFQGRFEWGPRALGNRSILADPRDPAMKEIVNTKIKFREQFRPFAPVVLEEAAPAYFDLGPADGQYPQRFMLMVAPARNDKAAEIPAVVHVGTGRLQTVRPEWNPLYYEVVRRFGAETGVPVCLNTSFNLRGEPMVASVEDALRTFTASDIDLLVLGHHVVRK